MSFYKKDITCNNVDCLLNIYKQFLQNLCKQQEAELRLLVKAMTSKKNIKLFRSKALCITCGTQASDPLQPQERYMALQASPLIKRIPPDVFSIIKGFIIPQGIHCNCYFIRKRESSDNVYKVYERRLISIYNPKKNKQEYHYRAVEPSKKILIYKDNVKTSLQYIKDINGDGVCKQIQSIIPFW